MNLWEFLKPKLNKSLILEVEDLAKRYPYKHKLVPTLANTKREMAKEILAILCSGNVAVPIHNGYGETLRKEVLSELEYGDYPDLAFVMFTSGTTGKPKGVMLTHENSIENLKSIGSYFDISKEDKILIARPLVHIAVLTGEFLFALYKGCEIQFYEEAFVPQRLAKMIVDEKITVFGGTPTLLYHLSNYIKISDLKTIVLSGERLNEKIVNIAREKFSHINFYHVYGLTEHSPRAFALMPQDFFKKAPSIGKPIANVEAKLIDGELCLKSKSLMQGYFKNEELTKQKTIDGYLHTGDMAKVDDDGYYYILGRKDEMIIRSGLNIYPQEIESVVLQNPLVENCLIYGEDDILYGQKVCLKVVGEINKTDLMNYLREKLPPHLIPNKIEIVESLPLTASGKVKR